MSFFLAQERQHSTAATNELKLIGVIPYAFQSRIISQCEWPCKFRKALSISSCSLGLNVPSYRVDEPFMWGILPIRTFRDTHTVRWTLGASDMMFNGRSVFESFAERRGDRLSQ